MPLPRREQRIPAGIEDQLGQKDPAPAATFARTRPTGWPCTLLLLAVAVFATDGFSELMVLILAVGVLFAAYAARRDARDALLYRDRQNR